MKKVATLCVIVMSLASVPSFAQSQTIPSGFWGKWAGMHTKREASPKDVREICRGNHDYQDSSVILQIDKKAIDMIAYYEDLSKFTPTNYTENSNNKIAGRGKLEISELGSDEVDVSHHNFEMKLQNGKLYETFTQSDGTKKLTVYSRCQ